EEVAQEKARRVAEPAVGVDLLAEDLVRDALIFAVVLGRDPEAQELSALLLDDVLRLDGVPETLRHLAARAIEREAVGQHDVVRRLAGDGDAGEERAVEPAAMLVAALEVEVGMAAQLRALIHDGGPADARVEPDVEDVRLAAKARAPAF